MKIVAASLETYKDELVKVVKEFWLYDYVIVGGYAKEIIRQQNILKIFQFVHAPELDDLYMDIRIQVNNVMIPIRSYNAIFIKNNKVIIQVYLDPETIPETKNADTTSIYYNTDDPYDLENDLLDNRATYKEIVLEDNKVKTARTFAKNTKSPVICVVNNINNIEEQLLDEFENLSEKWKKAYSHSDINYYNHYTVKDKIYHDVIVTSCYGTDIIFVEEKNIEDVSN